MNEDVREAREGLLDRAERISRSHNAMMKVFRKRRMPQLGEATAEFIDHIDPDENPPLAVVWEAVWSFAGSKNAQKEVASAVQSYFDSHRECHRFVATNRSRFGDGGVIRRNPVNGSGANAARRGRSAGGNESGTDGGHRHSFVKGLFEVIHLCDTEHMEIDHDGEILPAFTEATFHCQECDLHLCEDCFAEDFPRYSVKTRSELTAEPMWKNEIPWGRR